MDEKKLLNNILDENYHNSKLPGALSGSISKFHKTINDRFKSNNVDIKKEEIEKYLQSQDSFLLHKDIIKNFKRNKVIVFNIDQIWQADLCDVSNISKENKKFNFILTVIDVFSKYAWAVPLKNKTADSIINAFKEIFKSGRTPEKLHTDKGKEFINKKFQSFLKDKNITLFNTNSELKASIVERFNKTLKEKMYREFEKKNNHTYIDFLDDLLFGYNNTVHSKIKIAPSQVNKKNEASIRKIFTKQSKIPIRFKFQIGDEVLISKDKSHFSKGYEPKWVREVFVIHERKLRQPPVYIIRDTKENPDIIEGVFYEQQLQKVQKKIYRIEKILQEKIEKQIKYSLVKWEGYSEDFNSWVKSKDIIKKGNELLFDTSK